MKIDKNTKFWLAGAGVLIILIIIVRYNSTKHTVTALATPAPSQGPGKDTVVHAGPASATPVPSGQATPTPVTNPDHPATSTLAKPTGQILNNGSVSKSGASTTMESTCRSVVGAACFVRATKAGEVITVSDTKTIPDGASDGVIFDWDAKQLSVGTWKIQLVASKDGQTAISDSQNLEVTP